MALKRVVITCLVAVVASGVAASERTTREALRTMISVQKKVVAAGLAKLERRQADLREAWSRVDRLNADLVRAEEDGETARSLSQRDQDLRIAEGTLVMAVLSCQQLRSALMAAQESLKKMEDELGRLEKEGKKGRDPISGKWKIIIDPGGQEGVMTLDLDGTLVNGTYKLDGGWTGSLRGTFVAGKIRLERIDAQLGFAAVYHAVVRASGGSGHMEGSWEGTHLTAGMPGSGTWVADKVTKDEQPGYAEQ